MTSHLLSFVLFLPLAGMLALLAIPAENRRLIRIWANAVSIATFLLSLCFIARFDLNAGGYQFVERAQWIPSIGAQYLLGMDGISLLMVLLTTFISAIAALSSWRSITERTKMFYSMILLLETGVLGVFLSLDLFLFYLFWDVVLIPMYFLIGIYGSERRGYAAIKFFLYTLLGSLFMLLGFLALYFEYAAQYGVYTFDLQKLMSLNLPLRTEEWIFFALFFGFAVKSAHVSAAYLAARRAYRSADGRLRPAGKPAAQNGHLWISAVLASPVAESVNANMDCAPDGRALIDRNHLWRPGMPYAARLEAPRCLFLRQPHGFLHVRHFRAECEGPGG